MSGEGFYFEGVGSDLPAKSGASISVLGISPIKNHGLAKRYSSRRISFGEIIVDRDYWPEQLLKNNKDEAEDLDLQTTMDSDSGVLAKPIDWTAAFEQHRPWLRKVLSCRVGDRHTVEDLLQEVALAVFGKSEKPTNPDSVAPWLYRLAVRQSINYHRKSNRKSAPKVVADLEPKETSDPLKWLLDQEKDTAMQRALNHLRPQEHEILTLKYTENWTYRQLAKRLGVKEKTVEYRLLKARKRLRGLLAKEMESDSSN